MLRNIIRLMSDMHFFLRSHNFNIRFVTRSFVWNPVRQALGKSAIMLIRNTIICIRVHGETYDGAGVTYSTRLNH